MKKIELRQKYKELRNLLSEIEIESKSIEIANNLIKTDIWNNNFYHIFLPIVEKKEVNTEFVLHILQGKDKEILISKSDFETIEMTHFLLTDNTKFIKNQFNIPEPIDGIEVPVHKIEVVFIPLLAFDNNGNRVGYGKGFYDKFLSKCNPKTIKIGLSFFEPEAIFDDCFQTDIQLDYCVTPHQIFKF